MSRSFDEEYQLLSTRDDFKESEFNIQSQTRYGHTSFLHRTLRKHPVVILSVSITFLISGLAFFLCDVVYLKSKLAIAGSYTSFVSHLWPVGLPNRTDIWENENSKAMHSLMTCIAADNCARNQKSIVMLSSGHFAGSISGHVSGEDIWATSVLEAVRDLGYTAIFSTNNEQLARTYRQYPDLVKVIILEGSQADSCFSDRNCIKTVDHPLGVPAWKMFSFHFWTGAAHPLGNAWTLSPENYAFISPSSHSEENFYLGYSIENSCSRIPFIPNEERLNRAYILAKNEDYFYDRDYAWPEIAFNSSPFDIELVAGIASHSRIADHVLPKGVTDLGHLNKTQFYHHLGHSRVLIGIGKPFLSPSPYDALCMGVPFINPILSWDHKFPDNRTLWYAQHGRLRFQEPPYVYNVKKGDVDGFWDAVSQAIQTPIDRYIIPEMTMNALRYRVSQLVEGNWREKAETLLNERKNSGKGQLFEL